MKFNKIIILLILCVLIPSCFFEKHTEETQLLLDVQGKVNAWVSMWNEYNLTMVDKLFLTDDRITYFSSEKEGLIKGIEAVREHHAGFGFIEGGKVQDNKLWVEDLQINVYLSAAVAAGIWYFRRGPEGSKEITRGPVTFVYVREEGEFRLAHLHFSEYGK